MKKCDLIERRKAYRRPILSSFSFFVSLPVKGSYRLNVYDVSEVGMGFDFDIEGEDLTEHPLVVGDFVEVSLYLNQSVCMPLTLRVARVEGDAVKRRVGAEFQELSSLSYRAFLSFLRLIDDLHEMNTVEL